MFQRYQRIGTIEARPYEHDDQARLNISISEADLTLPTLIGGMVARNPDNHEDMWYIAADYFAKHYAPAVPASAPETAVAPRTCSWERRGDHFNCHACGSMSKTTQGRDEIIADCQRRPTANRGVTP